MSQSKEEIRWNQNCDALEQSISTLEGLNLNEKLFTKWIGHIKEMSSEDIQKLQQRIATLKEIGQGYEAELTTGELEDSANKKPMSKRIKGLLLRISNLDKQVSLKLGYKEAQSGKRSAMASKEKIDNSAERTQKLAVIEQDIRKRSQKRRDYITAHSVHEGNIRKTAQSRAGREARIMPITVEKFNQLRKIEENLDTLRKANVDANILEKSAAELKEFGGEVVKAVEIVGTGAFFSGLHTLNYLLFFPGVLAANATSEATAWVAAGARASEAFFQTFNDYYQNQQQQGGLANLYVIPRLITGGLSLLSAGVAALTGGISRFFDVDRMMREGEKGKAFIIGASGTLLLVGLVIASAFTFGIPIAAVAVGAGVAGLVSLVKIGLEYRKHRETQDARKNFSLSSDEELALLEYTQNLIKPVAGNEQEREKAIKANTAALNLIAELEEPSIKPLDTSEKLSDIRDKMDETDKAAQRFQTAAGTLSDVKDQKQLAEEQSASRSRSQTAVFSAAAGKKAQPESSAASRSDVINILGTEQDKEKDKKEEPIQPDTKQEKDSPSKKK